MSKRIREILTGVIFLGLVIAIVMGYQRYEYEMRNRNVEIAVNLNDIESMAAESGRQLPQEFALFKAPGTTTVLYKEETLADLKKYINLYSGSEFLMQQDKLLDNNIKKQLLLRGELNYNYSYIFVLDESVYKRISKHLKAKNPNVYYNSYDISVSNHPMWLVVAGLPSSSLSTLGLGFDERIISYLEKINIQVLPQIRTWDDARPDAMSIAFSDLVNHPNVRTILFNDKVLPGFPDKGRLYVLAQVIKQNNWNIGLIEFMDQKGFEDVAYANAKKVVRFFALDSKETDKITPDSAMDKYVLAASERNDKLVFVRPLNFSETSQELGYINHINELKGRLISQSLTVAPVRDSNELPISKYPVEFLVIIMSISVLSGGVLLADKLGWLKSGIVLAVLIFFVDIFLILHTADNTLDKIALAEKGMALLAAIIFPTYGILATISERGRNIWQSIGAFFKATGISFAGALFIIGFLADKAYMVKIDQYMGVKVAHIIPILLVLCYFYVNENDGKSVKQRLVDVLKEPITYGYALVSVIIIAALVIYVARTGNDATDLVSGWELKLRTILDHLLYVRPRTKEFLIGTPLLLIIYYLGYRLRYLPFLALAVIGPVSIVDTYAHIHTPILVSLLRTFNGLWMGIIIGLLCIAAYLYYLKNWGKEIK